MGSLIMIIEATGISCTYDGPDVLSDLSLRIEPGEFVAITGPNGSGKSTLLRTLSRVLKPKLGQHGFTGDNFPALQQHQPRRHVAAAVVYPYKGIAFHGTPRGFRATLKPHVHRFGGLSQV